MIAQSLVRLIARAVPAASRARYLEEWSADLQGAERLDVPRSSIVIGAASLVVTLDRTDPAVSGLSTGQLVRRRGRWAAAFLTSSAVLGFAVLLYGMQTVYDAPTDSVSSELSVLGRAVSAIALVALVLGLAWAVESLRAALRDRASRRRTAVLAAAVVLSPLVLLATSLVIPLVGMLSLLLLGVAVVVLLVAVTSGPRAAASAPSRGRRLAVAAPFGAAVLALVAAGTLHIMVWNPLAKLPGMTLDEIYAGLAAAGELPSPVFLVAWAVIWVAAAIAYVVMAASGRPAIARFLTARRLVALGLVLISATVFFQWFAGFGMGMGIADAFFTSGGDAAVSGTILSAIGFGATLAAIFVTLIPGPAPKAVPQTP